MHFWLWKCKAPPSKLFKCKGRGPNDLKSTTTFAVLCVASNSSTVCVLENPTTFENGLHAVLTHKGMLPILFASCCFLLFTSPLLVSGVCVHVCSFYSREEGEYRIMHKNKSMANSILHPECPLWLCMTLERTVKSTRAVGKEKTRSDWRQLGKRDWLFKVVRENESLF